MASENVKKAILKKKIGDIVYDLLVKTHADLVEVADNKTLTQKLTELDTAISGKATSADIQAAINGLIDSAPTTYDTLKEIADWITKHETEFEGLKTLAGKVMTGTDGENPGTAGTVPAPAITDKDKFLKGDGTWGTPTNTTYGKASADQDGLMSKEDFNKLATLENYDDTTLQASVKSASEAATAAKTAAEGAKTTAEEAKTAVDKKARVILDKTEPEDLTEADLFLQDLSEE